jgi:hypothetical protein
MWTQKEIVLFLAGAQTFHTLSHVVVAYLNILPIRVFNMWWTQKLNIIMIVINALLTAGLLWWTSVL